MNNRLIYVMVVFCSTLGNIIASAEVALTTIARCVYEKAERPGEFVVVLVNTTQQEALERYLASPLAIHDCCEVVGFESSDDFFGAFGVKGIWPRLKLALITNYYMAFGDRKLTKAYLTPYGGMHEKKEAVIEFLINKCVEFNLIISIKGDTQLEY